MKKAANKNGQILILVLLVVVVSLAIGLSVAARNLTNLRITTQTELSQRAFDAAEYGVENALQQLSAVSYDLKNSTNYSNCTPTSGTLTCNYQPGAGSQSTTQIQANVTVSKTTSFSRQTFLGDVAQVDMRQGTCTNDPCNIKIQWGNTKNSSEVGTLASLEVTLICTASDGTYGQVRYYILGDSHGGETVPLPPSPSLTWTTCPSPTTTSTFVIQGTASGGDFKDYAIIPVPKALFTALNNPKTYLMRIRPLFNNATISVAGASSNESLPVQAVVVDSSNDPSVTNGLVRRLQVTKSTLPQLPAVFDFALYSNSPIVK